MTQFLTGAVAANQNGSRNLLLTCGGLNRSTHAVTLSEAPSCLFDFGKKEVYCRWIYAPFSAEDCKEFGVDFGGWFSS